MRSSGRRITSSNSSGWSARYGVGWGFAPGQIQDDANIESLGVGIGRYADVNIPALLLGGARSPKHLRVRLDALASVLPNVDSVLVLLHQGHLADAFAPRKIAHIIESFAARVSL